MPKKQKPKFPRAFFKVPMGTQVISPKKGKGAKDLSPYSRKAKHKEKSTALDKFDPVVFLVYGGDSLFIAQRIDRFELGSLISRHNAENYPDSQRERKG